MNEVVFWDACENDVLAHEDIDDAIEELLDQVFALGGLPEVIEVKGYARVKPTAMEFEGEAIGYLLFAFDEKFGDPETPPDAPYTQPTPAMKAAERVFIEAVAAEYVSWACDPVITKEIDVSAWVRDHPGRVKV